MKKIKTRHVLALFVLVVAVVILVYESRDSTADSLMVVTTVGNDVNTHRENLSVNIPDPARTPIRRIKSTVDPIYGSIRGTLVDQDQITVGQGTIIVSMGKIKVTKDVDEMGNFFFSDLMPGEWKIKVNPDTVPWWAAIWGQNNPKTRKSMPPGFSAVHADVAAGSETSVEVILLHSASVEGRVVDANGIGVPGVYPSIRAHLKGAEVFYFSAKTDGEGYYRIEDVPPTWGFMGCDFHCT